MAFRRVVDGPEILTSIFPTKQRFVNDVISLAATIPEIEKIAVFGSAVTLDCGTTSDLDLALWLTDPSEDAFLAVCRKFYRTVDTEMDIINYKQIHLSLLRDEIDRKGVLIYAKCD